MDGRMDSLVEEGMDGRIDSLEEAGMDGWRKQGWMDGWIV